MKLKIYVISHEAVYRARMQGLRADPSCAALTETKEIKVQEHEIDRARMLAKEYIERQGSGYVLKSLNFGPSIAGRDDSPTQMLAYVDRRRIDAP